MRLGIAYVPEDRGTQGLVREMRIRENISMAILGSLTRFGVVNKAAERRVGQAMIDAAQHHRHERRAGRQQALGRQPAEGRRGQVAGQQAQAAHRR